MGISPALDPCEHAAPRARRTPREAREAKVLVMEGSSKECLWARCYGAIVPSLPTAWPLTFTLSLNQTVFVGPTAIHVGFAPEDGALI